MTRATIIGIGVLTACVGLFATSARAQVQFKLQVQDPFRAIDRADDPFTRENLRNISVDGEVLEAVRLLDSDDYQAREAATTQLVKDDARRMQLYALLSGDSLTTEQRYRLLQVVREQLIAMPRGALGIEMAPLAPMRGQAFEIRIANLIAGLPAERVLQVGDRIVAIDGQPLFLEGDLQNRVQSKRPGEKVSVTVKRSKVDNQGKVIKDEAGEAITETLELQIELGDAAVLDRQRDRFPVRPSEVQRSRLIEAETVMYAYAPQAKPLQIRGGARQLAHDNPIDQHPVIVNLLVQQEMLGERRGDQARMMRDMWQRQLADLIDLANQPGLSEQKREEMRLVADRFAQLMNTGS